MRERLHPAVDSIGIDRDLIDRVAATTEPDTERFAAGKRRDRLAGGNEGLRRHAIGEDAGTAEAVALDDDDVGA
jgi:hypothetical protein